MGVNANLKQLFNPDMANGANNGKLGQLVAGAATATNSTAVVLSAAAPAWVVSGMPVYDVTAGGNVGAVSGSPSGTAVTLAANSATAIATGDILQFGLPPADITGSQTMPYADDVRSNIWSAALKCQEAYQQLVRVKAMLTAASDATNATFINTQMTSLS